GIDRLYSHQADALHAAWAGPTIVTTGTASGKSLCFQLPTLDVLCRDAKARALYLYPAKALAQDQARSLHAFGLPRMRQAIYDGDVEPADHRREAAGAPLAAGGVRRPARRAGQPGRAHDRVHEVAQGRRADVEVRPARARGHGPGRPARSDRAVPRRLHAAAA